MIDTIHDRAWDVEDILKEIKSIERGIAYTKERINLHDNDKFYWRKDPLFNRTTALDQVERSTNEIKQLKKKAVFKINKLHKQVIELCND